MEQVLNALAGGLVVSCQALPGEPMYRADGGVMPLFAIAAERAGAVAIRANSARDVAEIKQAVQLPVIGLIKHKHPASPCYITPTMQEVDALVEAGADIVATQLTDCPRPDGLTVEQFVAAILERHPGLPIMADISTADEGRRAAAAGAHLVGTTLSGYTPQSQGRPAPDADLVATLAAELEIPVIAEGQVHTPEQARRMLDLGAHCVVVGGAITRPLEIAQRFVTALR